MKALIPKVGVAGLASPLEVGAERAPSAALRLSQLLEQAGCQVTLLGVIDSPAAAVNAGRKMAEAQVEAVALAAASWFEDYLALDLLEECPAPLLFWPLPGMETGALCGVQQAVSYLRQLDRATATVFAPIGAGAPLARGLEFLRAAAVRHRLRRARIGLAGQRVRGMTEVAANEIALKRTLGPRVAPVDMVGLLNRAREMSPQETQAAWNLVKENVGRVDVPDEDGWRAVGIGAALRETVRREGLAALAFGCYPDFMGYACLAASLLADEGIPVGCEGDVNATVGQLILAWLTGEPTHNTDWLDPLEDGSVVFSHCGSGSHSLAAERREIVLAPVRLARQGVCSLFPARTGAVTLMNLMPRGEGYQLAIMAGEALPATMVFPGNPLRVRFARPTERIIDWINAEGIGHHWAAGYGQVASELRAWAGMAGPGLRLLEL